MCGVPEKRPVAVSLKERVRSGFYGAASGVLLSLASAVVFWLWYLVDPAAVQRRVAGPLVESLLGATAGVIGACATAGFLHDQFTTTARSMASGSVVGAVAGAIWGYTLGGSLHLSLIATCLSAVLFGPLGGYIFRGFSIDASARSDRT